MAPPTPIGLPSAPSRCDSQAKKGWPSSRSMACASERTRAACSLQVSACWKLIDACSRYWRMRVRFAP